MMKLFKKTLLSIAFISAAVLGISSTGVIFSPSNAQAADQNSQIMFILDASSSMLYTDQTSSTRITKAKKALINTIKSVPKDSQVGVRVYGSKVPETDQNAGCKDTVRLSAPKANNSRKLTSQINNVQARGWTLIGKALEEVSKDFTNGEGPKTVILLSDGVDTCSPAKVCDIAKKLRKKDTDIKVHTVGIKVDKRAREQLTCVAKNTGGTYYSVNDIDRLQKALRALTERETTKAPVQEGVPIRGTQEIADAPIMLNETLYRDTLTIPTRLHYGFDALPEQKITITVTAKEKGNNLDWLNYLTLRSYTKTDGKKLSATAIFGATERFDRTKPNDTVTLTYTIDTKEQGITEAQPIAIGLDVSGASDKGEKVPIQIKVSATGGIEPDNVAPDTKESQPDQASDTTADPDYTWLWLILAAILVALVAAGGGYYAWRKKRQNSPDNHPDGTPTL